MTSKYAQDVLFHVPAVGHLMALDAQKQIILALDAQVSCFLKVMQSYDAMLKEIDTHVGNL